MIIRFSVVDDAIQHNLNSHLAFLHGEVNSVLSKRNGCWFDI